jgi:integrase
MGKDGLRRRGGIWHIDTCIRGRRIRQSCETPDRSEALSLLRQRVADLEQRGSMALRAPKRTFEELAKDLLRDYESTGKRALGKAEKSVERLTQFFGGWRAIAITTQDVRAYIEKRQRDAANGTINRELAALKRMFRLAAKAKLISWDHVPHIPMLPEAPPRAGFFEPEQFEAVLRHLPPEVRLIARFGYETGWRLQEIITMEWRQIDLQGGTARLDPGTTKNREGRLAYLSPALLEALQAQDAATRELELKRGRIIPWVFHRQGKQILRFLGRWRTACTKSGCPGRLFHDLRRTAVRNMVRAGVPERVAMQGERAQDTLGFRALQHHERWRPPGSGPSDRGVPQCKWRGFSAAGSPSVSHARTKTEVQGMTEEHDDEPFLISLRAWLGGARLREVVHVVQLIRVELTRRGVTFLWSLRQSDLQTDDTRCEIGGRREGE